MTSRRQLLLVSALWVVAPGILAQSRKVPRVAVLHAGYSNEPAAAQREPFESGLRELGWLPGSTVIIDYRYAEGDATKLSQLANDLAYAGVDVIVARANAAISAARKATSTIPIVTSGYTGDPAADGVVNNVARPGGNVTGVASFPSELDSKRMELLKEAFPSIRRVGVVLNPALDGVLAAERMSKLRAGAQSLGMQLEPFEIRRAGDIPSTFAAIGKAGVDALLVRGDPLVLDANRAD